jgi:plasmid stabilization system protein ParE
MAAKKVIWSIRAQQDRIAILEYWINRNKSKTYSQKLYHLFNQAVDLIAEHPHIGRPTSFQNVKFKVVRKYQIFYEELQDRIEILLIWDSRRNPETLEKIIKNK